MSTPFYNGPAWITAQEFLFTDDEMADFAEEDIQDTADYDYERYLETRYWGVDADEAYVYVHGLLEDYASLTS